MKKVETKNYVSTKQTIVGNKVRNIIIIDKKSKTASSDKVKNVSYTTATIKKRCSGCSRTRRG